MGGGRGVVRVATPVATLAASVLVLAGGANFGSAAPTMPALENTGPMKGATSVPLRVNADIQRARALTAFATPAAPHKAHRASRSAAVVDVRSPAGTRTVVRSEERPGASSSRVDTVRRCVQDFQVTTEHIGC